MSAEREALLGRLQQDTAFDVLVVGGGINGAVTAASLAASGVKVALVDRGDFASETSEHSSNLAWGGIKYLESFEFPLVNKLCKARNHLMRSLPSQVREIRFMVAHEKGFRHARLKIFLGALVYWVFGRLFTRPPRLLSLDTLAREEPVIARERLTGGFEYSDAYLIDNDARFVFSFIRTAVDRGAVCVNYVKVVGARRVDGLWHADLEDTRSGRSFSVRARVLVNAAGPWVDRLNTSAGITTEHRHVFSKGIHLIVPRVTDHERVLTFFADDGRLFFAIPMGSCTCIGTTDTRVDEPETGVTDADRRFVLDNINKRLTLKQPLALSDVIGERCGVRPLVVRGASRGDSEWFQLSRKHVVETNVDAQHISIFGGKLTDCVNVGEEVRRAVQSLGVDVNRSVSAWYGEPDAAARARFFARARSLGLVEATPGHEAMADRLWRRYGTRAGELLDDIEKNALLRAPVVDGIDESRAELRWAARTELVVTLEDWLRRRTRAQLTTPKSVLHEKAVRALCAELFGKDADAQARAYLADMSSTAPATSVAALRAQHAAERVAAATR